MDDSQVKVLLKAIRVFQKTLHSNRLHFHCRREDQKLHLRQLLGADLAPAASEASTDGF